MKQPKYQALFSTPLYQFPADLPQQVNDKLKKALLEMEKSDKPIVARSNAGGWRSKFLEDKEDICFQILSKYIDMCFKKVLELTTSSEHKCQWKKNSWAIINRKNDYNLPHSHPNCDWSCVYYVDSGDQKDKSVDGKIMFIDPRGSLVENSRTVSNQDALYGEMFGSSHMALSPSTGLLIFFPSWLIHSVSPSKGSKPRIIISTNYCLER